MNLMLKQINWHFIYQSGFTVFMSSYLLLIAGTTLGMINLNVLFFSLVLLSVLAIIWIIKSKYQISPLRNAILFWVVAFLFTTFFSIDPRRSIDQFILCSVGIFIFYFSCFLVQKGWQINTIYQGLLFSGAILMLFAWLEFGSWYSQWLSVNPEKIIPTIQYRPASANIIALNLNLFLIIAINRIMQPGIKKVFRIILSLYIFSDLIILYLTSSRGGWFGTIAGIGSYILLSFIVNKEQSLKIIRFIKNNRLYKYLLIASVIFFVTAFVYILILQSNHPTHGNIFTSRSPFWIPAWKEFLKDPMSGTGPFTYGSTFMRYNSVPNDAIYAHSHGTSVNLLTEMGIPGIAAGIFLVGSAFLSLWKKINFPDKKIQTTSHLALSALAAVGVHSLFDCFHLEPGGIWILYILIAIPLSINIIDIPKHGRPWLSLLPALMLSILIWMRLPYVQGVNYANSNLWGEASISFQKAVNRDPWSAIAHQQLGITYAVLANSKPEFSLQSAIDEINITIQSEPSWALNYANLAALYASNGNLSEAQKAALKSVELAPNVALYQLNLGSIAEKNQEYEIAKVAYMSTLQIGPGWATSDYWKSSELRQSVIDEWNLLNPPVKQLNFAEIEALYYANLQSTWAYNQLAQAYLENGNPDRAEELLSDASQAYAGLPSESIETTWLKAEVFATRGDYQQAIMIGEQAIQGFLSYGIYGPGSFGILYYAPRMFRSLAIAMEIVPQMVDVPVPEKWMERQNRLQYWKTKS